MVSGMSQSCDDGYLNGAWAYKNTTADGKNYYSHDTRYGGGGTSFSIRIQMEMLASV